MNFCCHIIIAFDIFILLVHKVFTSWILSRILCVLANANCSALHDKSISAIISLLQVRTQLHAQPYLNRYYNNIIIVACMWKINSHLYLQGDVGIFDTLMHLQTELIPIAALIYVLNMSQQTHLRVLSKYYYWFVCMENCKFKFLYVPGDVGIFNTLMYLF